MLVVKFERLYSRITGEDAKDIFGELDQPREGATRRPDLHVGFFEGPTNSPTIVHVAEFCFIRWRMDITSEKILYNLQGAEPKYGTIVDMIKEMQELVGN